MVDIFLLIKTFHILIVESMATNNSSSLSLRSVLEKDKMSRTKFLNWYCNLRIVLNPTKDAADFLDWFCNLRFVLTQQRKFYVLEVPPLKSMPRTLQEHSELLGEALQ